MGANDAADLPHQRFGQIQSIPEVVLDGLHFAQAGRVAGNRGKIRTDAAQFVDLLEQGYIAPDDLGCREQSGVISIGEALTYKLTGKGMVALDERRRRVKGICFQIFLVLLAALLAVVSALIAEWIKPVVFSERDEFCPEFVEQERVIAPLSINLDLGQ